MGDESERESSVVDLIALTNQRVGSNLEWSGQSAISMLHIDIPHARREVKTVSCA